MLTASCIPRSSQKVTNWKVINCSSNYFLSPREPQYLGASLRETSTVMCDVVQYACQTTRPVEGTDLGTYFTRNDTPVSHSFITVKAAEG